MFNRIFNILDHEYTRLYAKPLAGTECWYAIFFLYSRHITAITSFPSHNYDGAPTEARAMSTIVFHVLPLFNKPFSKTLSSKRQTRKKMFQFFHEDNRIMLQKFENRLIKRNETSHNIKHFYDRNFDEELCLKITEVSAVDLMYFSN